MRKKTPLKRRTPLRKRGRKWKENHVRQYGTDERIEWMQDQPCIVCGRRPTENAHVKPKGDLPKGMGRKNDARWIVPLCGIHREDGNLVEGHHQELDSIHEEAFQRKYSVDLDLEATTHWYRWEERK